MTHSKQILRLDASANLSSSNSKKLGDQFIDQLKNESSDITLKQRDLNQEITFIDEAWVNANFTTPADRDASQASRLAYSDSLIEELQWADHIVLTTPMYNFSVPASLKAWIDLVCRAGVTFQYTEKGPVGLLTNKRVDIIVTTGGVPLQSPVDFLSDYLKQVFKFIGIDDIHIIAADQMNVDAQSSFDRATGQIQRRLQSLKTAA